MRQMWQEGNRGGEEKKLLPPPFYLNLSAFSLPSNEAWWGGRANKPQAVLHRTHAHTYWFLSTHTHRHTHMPSFIPLLSEQGFKWLMYTHNVINYWQMDYLWCAKHLLYWHFHNFFLRNYQKYLTIYHYICSFNALFCGTACCAFHKNATMRIIFPTLVAAKATISIWNARLICSLKLLARAKSRLWLNISVERRESIDWRNGWPFRDEPPRGRTVLRAFYEVSSLTSHRTRTRALINSRQSAWECSSYVTVTLTLWVQASSWAGWFGFFSPPVMCYECI